MTSKTHILRFRAVNRDIFDAIKTGRKKVETRASTKRYQNIAAKDKIKFVCGRSKFERVVKEVKFFKNISSLLEDYSVGQINPHVKNEAELRKMFFSFPAYREKIEKYGLVTFEMC